MFYLKRILSSFLINTTKIRNVWLFPFLLSLSCLISQLRFIKLETIVILIPFKVILRSSNLSLDQFCFHNVQLFCYVFDISWLYCINFLLLL